MVWLVMAHGITDLSIVRLYTIPTASSTPSVVPITNPSSVAESVTHA